MNEMTFEPSKHHVAWREVARVRYGMIVYHGFPPTVLLLGKRVKISLWSKLVCRLFFGISVKRVKS